MRDQSRETSPDTVSVDVRIDRLCDRFEHLLLAGLSVSVADFLRNESLDPAAVDPVLLRELDRVAAFYDPDHRPTVIAVSAPPSDPPKVLTPGQELAGRYVVRVKIGGGGMGEVWAADQVAPVCRPVAVKVIKAGLDSKAVLARFEAERQALALVAHPNIAAVLDAGTTDDGHPFFVMELVAGTPISRYCDERTLTVRQRLELFLPVCRAVQHAHRRGVIHRDLKPSNVLVAEVDGRPVPKVIDFGVAKAVDQPLTARTLDTGFAVIGTPEYMSPEQAAGDPTGVDTRTDVYSLGVMLYELLTGDTPLGPTRVRRAALLEVLRLVGEFEPPKVSDRVRQSDTPSAVATARNTDVRRLARQVRGDLDWVLVKALEKDRDRRYASPDELAAEIARHLAGQPVEAGPPSARYRLAKFVRRNRAAVTAAAVVFAALVLGIVGTSLGLAEARRQAGKADEARGKEATQRGIADGERAKAVEQLWRAQLSEARAIARSGQVGQRIGSLDSLRKALAVADPSTLTADDRKQFRDVATAALALPDLEDVKSWPGLPAGTHHLSIDGRFERYARSDEAGNVTVRRVSDDAELYALPTTGRPRMVTLSKSGQLLVVSDNAGPEDKRVGRVYRLDGPAPELIAELPILMGLNVFVTAPDKRVPDGERVVFTTGTAVGVWDARTGKTEKWPLPGRSWGGPPPIPGQQCGGAALSPDGTRLAVPYLPTTFTINGISAKYSVHVRDTHTGGVVAELPLPGWPEATALSPDGTRLAVALGRRIHLWDVDAKRAVGTLDGHAADGIVLAFDGTGERLLSNDDGAVLRVWDWRAGRQVFAAPAVSCPHALPVSADGLLLARARGTDRLRLLRLHTAPERRAFAVPLAPVHAVHADPGGRFAVVTQRRPGEFGRPFVVDTADGSERAALPIRHTGERVVRIASDGALLAAGHSGVVRWPLFAEPDASVLRFGPPQQVLAQDARSVEPPPSDTVASGDGRTVAVPRPGGGARVLSLDRLGGEVTAGARARFRHAALSPDGRFGVTAAAGEPPAGGVNVWDARTGHPVAELAAGSGPTLFSPDGRWLVTHDPLRVWRTADWTAHANGPTTDATSGCAFSPDSRVLAVDGPSEVRLLRVADGAELARLPFAERSAIRPQCFGRHGAVLLALVADTGEVVAWDLRRLRSGLAELGLDWDEPPLPPADPPRPWRAAFAAPDARPTPADHRRSVDELRARLERFCHPQPGDTPRVVGPPGVPSQFHLLHSLACHLRELGEWHEAEAAFRRAVNLLAGDREFRTATEQSMPMAASAVADFAACLIRQGKATEADAECRRFADRLSALVNRSPEVPLETSAPVPAVVALFDAERLARSAARFAAVFADEESWPEAVRWSDRALDFWRAVGRRSAAGFRPDAEMVPALECKALALHRLGRAKDAVAAIDEAIRLGPDAGKPDRRMTRARYLAKAGDHREAVRQVTAELAAGGTSTWDAALAYAVAAGTTDDANRREEYALAAVALLRKCVEANRWNHPWQTDPDLNVLRERPDFKTVLAAAIRLRFVTDKPPALPNTEPPPRK